MARRSLAFRFDGADQDTGARHLRPGRMVEARNVRQIKAGEYRKRRGFSRVDPLEVVVIDTTTYRKGATVLYQGQFSTAAPATTTAGEAVLGGATGQLNAYIPWDWPTIGVSRVKVGVCASWTVATNDATVRIRVGGTPTNRGDITGTIVKSQVISVGANQMVDVVSSEFARPTSRGYIMITVQAVAGSTTVTPTGLSVWVAPVGMPQAQAFGDSQDWTNSGTSEIVRAQWYVDFDRFDASVSSLTASLCGRTFQAVGEFGTYALRMGGTAGVADGTVLVQYARNADIANDGQLSGSSASMSKPSGVQLIKGTIRSTAGATAEMRGCSVLFKAA